MQDHWLFKLKSISDFCHQMTLVFQYHCVHNCIKIPWLTQHRLNCCWKLNYTRQWICIDARKSPQNDKHWMNCPNGFCLTLIKDGRLAFCIFNVIVYAYHCYIWMYSPSIKPWQTLSSTTQTVSVLLEVFPHNPFWMAALVLDIF